MKNMQFKEYQLVAAILGLLIFLSACTQNATNSTPTPHNTEIAISSVAPNGTLSVTAVVPTPTYSTAPADAELDQICRITITYFFSVDKSFEINVVRNLFVPSKQGFADFLVQRQSPLILLQILPANEMWQKYHPNESIPKL